MISNDLTQMINFPTWLSNCDSLSPAIVDLFSMLLLVFFPQLLSFHWEILIMLLSQFPLTFHHIQNGMPHFITLLVTILVLMGQSSWSFEKMFHGRKSLNLVLLLLLVNVVSVFRLELIYISLIINVRSNLTHHHGFQLLVLLPYLIESLFFFICTNRMNLQNLK